MPSPTDFNLSPYYDDFSESKNFHRILFRPAFAVQARELTQLQSIQQNQIERLSDHIFEQGAMVIPGEIGYDTNYYAVKLSSFSGTLANYVGSTFTGGSSGVQAIVVNVSATDGTDPNTLFVKYIKTGTNTTAVTFTDSETITGIDSSSTSVSATVSTTATGSAAEIQAGTYYINGFHVQVANQTLILDKYTNTPSYRVGLTISESYVTPSDDSSLNDNATGSSNVNAPGAHRFKVSLTLAKKSLTATDDSTFIELLRLNDGKIQNHVRSTDYSIIEDNLARRTYDESGDYSVRDFDIDIRESVLASNNRGRYSSGATTSDGGTAATTKLAIGIGPGKAYVKGYEVEQIGTTWKDVDKARDFSTQNAFPTRFDVNNYVNVTKVYGTPDVTFVSGDVEAFKLVSLWDTLTAADPSGSIDNSSNGRGTAVTQATTKTTIPQIGRAKSRGFEHVAGSDTSDLMSSSSLTSATYKHFLFDIEMFTHLNVTTNTSFTTGETVTGGTSGATGIVESISGVKSATFSSVTQASPGVVTSSAHGFKEGQQISFSGSLQVDSSTVTSATYTVRNVTTNTFELYSSDGTTAVNVSSNTVSGSGKHGVVVVSNVQGVFTAGETITGGTSSGTAVIQSDAVGLNGVQDFDFSSVKQVSMAGSPTYTADVDLTSTYGEHKVLTGSLSVANSGTAITGFNTKFQTELRIGDQISFTNDAGSTVTSIVEAIISNTSLTTLVAVGGSDVSTKSVATRKRTKLQGSDKNIALFELPYKNIKTLKTTDNSGVVDTSCKVRRNFTGTLSSNGDITITADTNETFDGVAEKDFVVSIMTAGGSSSTGAVGDVLSVAGTNHEGDTIFSAPSTTTLKFDWGSNFNGHKVKIIATITRSTVSSKTKTLTSTTTTVNTEALATASGGVNLGKADVYSITNVYMADDFDTAATTSDTDIASRFDLDTGMRDNFYDIGRLKLKPGKLQPTGRLLVSFKYFAHGTGDFFDVDSYSGVVDYSDIPSYTSDTTGTKYELRDCLDFRPRVDDASTIDAGGQNRSFDGSGASTVSPIKFGSDVNTDHEYYLNRIDKIFIDKEGNLKVVKGASDLRPQSPENLDGAMHLYTLRIPSYTLSPEEVDIEKVDNRRYTMRDIGKLERRIENVEYYTQLNLLEQSAQSLQIQDSEGLDRFKNGFIVDNFTGHNIGDVGNIDYKCSMDFALGELRPTHHTEAVSLIERDDDGTAIVAADRTSAGYQKTGDLLTLPYSATAAITQPFATKTIPVNPFDIFTWMGFVNLTPPGDEWFETERLPEIITNNTGQFDTLASNMSNSNILNNPFGTVWNEWQDFWTGVPQETTTSRTEEEGGTGRRARFNVDTINSTQQVQQTRTGIRTRLVTAEMREELGGSVVSMNILPFIRNRTITWSATRMKPNTKVYPFFDNVDISSYCTPTGGSLGGTITTDSNGAASGTFAVPDPTDDTKPRWRAGRRVFRLTSSSTDSRTVDDVETAAEADYTARGILDSEGSTREFSIVRQSVVDDRAFNRTSTRETRRVVGWIDPLAQSFLVDDVGGIFLTGVDLYFSAKDDNIPVTVQIQEMKNGYPAPSIVPFSTKSLNPGDVNTSTDGTTATSFTFDSPVYIEENKEYCFVVIAQCNTYQVYGSRMGETTLDGTRKVSRQPYAGVLFKSQNGSTYTADQNEDLKFTLNKASFTTGSSSVVTLTNDTVNSKTLATNPIRTTSGSARFRVFHKNHGMHGTSNNVTISGISGSQNGLAASVFNATHTAIENITLDSYDIISSDSSTATSSGDVGGSAVVATENRIIDLLNLQLGTLTVPGTKIAYQVRPTTGKSINGSESEFSLTSASNAIDVIAGDNIYFTKPYMVASEINETNEMSGGKSLYVTATLTSDNANLSPVIDVQRMSAICVQNRLNSHTSANHPDYVADTKNQGTTSDGVYLTRPVTLENLSSALDIRLTANVRSTSEIEVYYRTTSADETRDINDISWTAFNSDGSEDTTITPAENNTTFNEYKYSASSIVEFTAFQVKVVMKGTNSAYPPRIKDLRGIALAI